MWDLPGPGLEPLFPALAGGFLTTAPPGKPTGDFLNPNSYHLSAVLVVIVIIGTVIKIVPVVATTVMVTSFGYMLCACPLRNTFHTLFFLIIFYIFSMF